MNKCVYGLGLSVLCLALVGCNQWNLRGEGFHDDEMSKTVRKARPEKTTEEYWSLSEKGRQIEKNLHAQQ